MTDEITREMFQHSTVVIAGLNDRIAEQAAEIKLLREALTTIRDRKWNTMTQGCDAACEAAHLARAALGDTQ